MALRRRLSPGLPLSHTSQGGKRSCRSTPGGVLGSFIPTVKRRLFNRVVTARTVVSGPLFVRAPPKCAESQQTSGPCFSYCPSGDHSRSIGNAGAWASLKRTARLCSETDQTIGSVAVANFVLTRAPDGDCRASPAKTCGEIYSAAQRFEEFSRSRCSLTSQRTFARLRRGVPTLADCRDAF